MEVNRDHLGGSHHRITGRVVTTEIFDVLVTGKHTPNLSDGFAVVTAHAALPTAAALTFLVSGYHDMKSAKVCHLSAKLRKSS